MEIIKTGVKDLDFSKMTLGEVKQYWTTIEGDSLHQVLPGRYRQPYLCQLKKEIEGVSVTHQEIKKSTIKTWDVEGREIEIPALKYRERGIWDEDTFQALKFDNRIPDLPVFWGAEPDWAVCSFADFTFIENEEMKEPDVYSTPEVLKVLEQWIEYLEKFEQEKAR